MIETRDSWSEHSGSTTMKKCKEHVAQAQRVHVSTPIQEIKFKWEGFAVLVDLILRKTPKKTRPAIEGTKNRKGRSGTKAAFSGLDAPDQALCRTR